MNVRNLLQNLKIENRAYINGEFIESSSGAKIKKFSSIDGEPLPEITACNEDDVNLAVTAAKNAFQSWADLTPLDRKNILLKLADLMEENRQELALLDTYETGRTYKNYFYDSIPKSIEAIRYFAESVDKYYDKAIPARGNEFGVIVRVPLGVVGAITPWNDPLVVSAWKFAPALLMGNTIIIKPAEQSSLSLLKVAALTKIAGIPNGVFNVVPGYGEVAGKALALNNDVRGIFFTGSSEIGKQIMIYAGQSNMKKVALECGGKGPYIVTKNCGNISESAKVLAENMFYNQGQICSAPSRVIVDESRLNEFVECLKIECEKFVPGDSFDDENNVGCVVSEEQFNKVQNYIEMAKNEGAEVYQAKTKKPHSEKARCIQPTIIVNPALNSRVATEEIFGPVVVILPVKSTAEALEVANNSKYGLAGAVWTDNIDEAYNVARNLEIGLVHINSYGNDDNSVPFGGVKESGLGKDKSVYAFDEYSDLKTVWMHFK